MTPVSLHFIRFTIKVESKHLMLDLKDSCILRLAHLHLLNVSFFLMANAKWLKRSPEYNDRNTEL